MKKLALVTTLLVHALPAAAAEGEITAVTVYSDRAEITRSLTAKCDGSGRSAITFPALPTTLDVRTLRAEASGRARTIGVSNRRTSSSKSRDAEEATLQEQLEAIEAQIAALHDEQTESDERLRAVGGYSSYYKTIVAEAIRDPRAQPAKWKTSVDFLAAQIEAERLAAVERRKTIREKQREAETLRRRLRRFGPQGPREIVEATVALTCEGENAPTVSLSYVVPGATWRPEYDLRFSAKGGTGNGRVALTVGAIVTQSTGEDWTDAKLALSTSKPRLGSAAPLPAPLFVDGHEASDDKVLISGQEERKSLSVGGPGGGGGPTQASLEDHGRTFTLTIPHRATVRADGRPYWMPVDRVSTKGTAKLVAVPKLSRFVYVAVDFENPAAYPLLDGVVHLYRDGAWVGDTTLGYRAPREPIELSLGIDESFRVERIDLREADQTTSFFGGTRRYERRYRTKIENRSSKPGTVEIREHVPVSKDEHIEVTLDEETTAGHRFDAVRGYVTFSLAVPPRESKSTDLAYTIALPKDWQVN